jgi:hypothetical protein
MMGEYPNHSNCTGGFDMEWSTHPYTQRVSKILKKNLKKVLDGMEIMLYLWGGGWARLSSTLL